MKEKKRLAMEAYRKAKEKYPDADNETLQQLVAAENRRMQHKSRAYYRIQAGRSMTGQGSAIKKPDMAVKQKAIEASTQKTEVVVQEEGIYFQTAEMTVVESVGVANLVVCRHGSTLNEMVEVDYATSDGTALDGDDYEAANGTLIFAPGETEKNIGIVINDDDIFELDEHFFCKLSNARNRKTGKAVKLGKAHTATVTILDDDYPGVFTIENPQYKVSQYRECLMRFFSEIRAKYLPVFI